MTLCKDSCRAPAEGGSMKAAYIRSLPKEQSEAAFGSIPFISSHQKRRLRRQQQKGSGKCTISASKKGSCLYGQVLFPEALCKLRRTTDAGFPFPPFQDFPLHAAYRTADAPAPAGGRKKTVNPKKIFRNEVYDDDECENHPAAPARRYLFC